MLAWEAAEKAKVDSLGVVAVAQLEAAAATMLHLNWERHRAGLGPVGSVTALNVEVDKEFEAQWLGHLSPQDLIRVWGS